MPPVAGLLLGVLPACLWQFSVLKKDFWLDIGRGVADAQCCAFRNVISNLCEKTNTIRAMKDIGELVTQDLGLHNGRWVEGQR